MSVLLAAVTTVTSTPVPTPSPEAVAVATTHASSIGDTLNALSSHVSQADLLVAAGVAAVALQIVVNKIKILRDAEKKAREVANYLISFALPFAGAALASFASGQNDLHLAPWIYLAGQFLYMVYSNLRKPAVSPVSEFQQ